MTCYHPLKAFKVGYKENGKLDLKVTSYGVDHVERRFGKFGDLITYDVSVCKKRDMNVCKNKVCSSECYDIDWSLVGGRSKNVYTDFITIPCGQCLGCRIQQSREWANRMVMELPYSECSYFITLTYDDDHVPRSEYLSPSDGVLSHPMTLVKSDFQKFMKRLRRRFPDANIRFYAAGEYGDTSQRPHYHAILYNCHLEEYPLHFLSMSREGFPYYSSDLLSDVWTYGFNTVCAVSWETCAYVARYVTKKKTGELASEYYDRFNIEPPFCLMSRKPGLGNSWLRDHLTEEDLITYIIRISNTNGEPLKFHPPRYFMNLYDAEFPDTCAEIKETQQRLARDRTALKLEQTDLSYLELLEVEERLFKSSTSVLKRGDT